MCMHVFICAWPIRVDAPSHQSWFSFSSRRQQLLRAVNLIDAEVTPHWRNALWRWTSFACAHFPLRPIQDFFFMFSKDENSNVLNEKNVSPSWMLHLICGFHVSAAAAAERKSMSVGGAGGSQAT